ncbi:MAG: phosphatase PAP2 family protein [Eubacterium sp.]
MVLDWMILNGIQEIFKCDFMDVIMPQITKLGNAGIIWIAIGLCMLISKKYRRQGFMVLIGLLMGLIIGNGLVKNLVARQRPCWINSDFLLLIPNPKDFSFPSGHTQASVIAATILTMYNRKWGIVVIPLAALIAFSRLYLYVHFPSDVLGGAIMGLIIGVGTFIIGETILRRIELQKKQRIQNH